VRPNAGRLGQPPDTHDIQPREIAIGHVGRDLVCALRMLPRQVLPGQFYLITRRCCQRQLLLRPDAATNNAFRYCLIDAALRCEIDVLLPCAMSNHYHVVIYDRAGRYPEFIEHLHKLLARSQNALRGRWENFWSCEQTCVVNLVDREAVIDKLVYTATNPVLDHLVDRAHHWPGVNGLAALLGGHPLRATRPLHFFRPNGPMADALELPLTIPSELGPADEVLAALRERVQAIELERAADRQRTGRRVLGRRAVLAQSWRDYPASHAPRRNLRPRVAARSKWHRIEALLRNRTFAEEYADARSRWRAGMPAVFPPGTYWLQRFASVPVIEAR
jgi:REP element-mobilizing transposase RayT